MIIGTYFIESVQYNLVIVFEQDSIAWHLKKCFLENCLYILPLNMHIMKLVK